MERFRTEEPISVLEMNYSPSDSGSSSGKEMPVGTEISYGIIILSPLLR